jgi:hypothetical protein
MRAKECRMLPRVDEHSIGRRRNRRHQICVAGSYRTGSGGARTVELTDLSLTGCRFIEIATGYTPGPA